MKLKLDATMARELVLYYNTAFLTQSLKPMFFIALVPVSSSFSNLYFFLSSPSCQFVVIDDQDYQGHFTDPDTLVDWDCVQQVVRNLFLLLILF